jgi:hypothetical protein
MQTIPLSNTQIAKLGAAQQRVLNAHAAYQQALAHRTDLLVVLFDALGLPEHSEVDFEAGAIVVPDAPVTPVASPGDGAASGAPQAVPA